MARIESERSLLGAEEERRRRRPTEKERSGRVGSFRGRPARTFHCHFGSVKCGASTGDAIDYAARIGETVERTAELEHVAGDPDRLRRAADAVDAAAWIKGGERAERVLVTQTLELPADATAARRAAAADAIVADWEARGHAAIAAVHGNDLVQPHVHVLATARPVAADGTVDRSVRLWTSRAEVRAERARIAELVNEASRPGVEFHPGRLEDTGIDRKAKRRLPPAVWHAMEERDRAEIAALGLSGEPAMEELVRRRALRTTDPEEVARKRAKETARREAADAAAGAREGRPARVVLVDLPTGSREAARARQIPGAIEWPEGLGIDAADPAAAELAAAGAVAARFRPKRGALAAAADAATTRLGETEERARALRALTERQATMIRDVFAELGIDVPDLDSEEGRAEAFARVREARARPRPPAAALSGLDEAGLRKAWLDAGRAIRQAGRDLREMPDGHPGRADTAERLAGARAARAAAGEEAARRGLDLTRSGRRDRGRGR